MSSFGFFKKETVLISESSNLIAIYFYSVKPHPTFVKTVLVRTIDPPFSFLCHRPSGKLYTRLVTKITLHNHIFWAMHCHDKILVPIHTICYSPISANFLH